MLRSGPLWLTALVSITASTSVARAANDFWDGNGAVPPNNSWTVASSWVDNTTPGNSDTANFNLAAGYTVTFTASPNAIQSLTVSAGDVVFRSNNATARTLSVTSASGTQDVSITGATTFLTLGASPSNDVNLIAGDNLSVQNDAALTAQFGSNVTAADFSASGLNGSVVMDGPGATLALTGAGANNFIGRSGNTGFLLLVNGTAGNSIAGNLGIADSGTANSLGVVNISGGSTLSLVGNLTLANQNVAGQFATLDIDDPNSSLTLSGVATSITVGSATNGTAAINIGVASPGATLTTSTGLLTINATGTVTIGGGANTGTLNANGNVTVNGGALTRGFGSAFTLAAGRTMRVQNGGLFDVTGTYLADGTYIVTGAGSTWTNSSILHVGNVGTGTLTVSAGGAITSNASVPNEGAGLIGVEAGSDGTITVTGAGSTWTNSSALFVGSEGTGRLRIEDGGAVSNTFGDVGTLQGSDGSVRVNGVGSTWTNSSRLMVAFLGTGQLTIDDGGAVSSAGGILSGGVFGNADVIVYGAGSTWTNSLELSVGENGTASLSIEQGGAVSNTVGRVGGNFTFGTSGDGSVNVSDAGSTWTNSSELYVGVVGTGSLTITDAGAVSNTVGHVGFDVGSNGSVVVTGVGSTWTNTSELCVGEIGSGTLEITKGGVVFNTFGSVGLFEGSDGAVNVIGGDGVATWTNSSFLFVGQAGTGALTVKDGGAVSSILGIVGYNPTGAGDVTVTGAGSTWTNSLDLMVGGAGVGSLTIAEGGAVFNTVGHVASGTGSNGDVTVTGAGSTWTNSSFLYVGFAGTGSLTIEAGGAVSSTDTFVGLHPNSDGDVFVTGAGSTWTIASLNVGGVLDQLGGAGTVNAIGGGLVQVSGNTFVWDVAAINVQTGGTFNANGDVTIDAGVFARGSGSAFNLAAGKTMAITNGGRATFTGGYTTASNAVYNVSGGGSVLEIVSGSLVIGNGAEVNVSGSGSLSSSSFLDIGISGGDGTLVVSGIFASASGAAPGLHSWALNGHAANVTFRNSATGSFLGGINLAGSAIAGTTANADVLSGADLSVGNLFLATAGGATTSAALTVDGAGSSITQTGGSALIVGHSSTGSASLIVRNNASFTTGTGLIVVEDTGLIELNSGAVFDALGAISMSGGVFKFLGGTLHVDNFNGDLVNQGGTLAPGHSPGITNIIGNYKQGAAATLQIEIGGTTAGTEFDTLNVSGETTLAGTLEVSLIDSFNPSLGDTFQILTSGGNINGTFATELLPALAGGLFLDVEYTQNKVVLFTSGVLGDYNVDGTVDAADYVVWRKTVGQDGDALAADGNGNGTIDPGDYNVWREHFGQTAGSGAGASANAVVPEPATLVLLMFAAAGWCRWRGRAA